MTDDRLGDAIISDLEAENDALRAQLQTLRGERDQARETNTRLNRRCQEYERGLAEKVDPLKGQSFGRGLANAAAEMYLARAEKAEADLAACQQRLARIESNNDPDYERTETVHKTLAAKDRVIDHFRSDLAAGQERERALREALLNLVNLVHQPNPTDPTRWDVAPGNHKAFCAWVESARAALAPRP